ncbi:hypothetical protein [Paenibacillus alginolyticus]|uniref:hypothetical protein n=1 Tax=Paenibacillus alginolyticus TaxID=59839 RepID=UPI001567C331|nr:hypothetical protein [Paenibacillus frigoriresistens]
MLAILHPALDANQIAHLVAGGWWLVAGVWWLVAGGWCLVAGGWWLVAGVWWLVAGGWCLNNYPSKMQKVHQVLSILAISRDLLQKIHQISQDLPTSRRIPHI